MRLHASQHPPPQQSHTHHALPHGYTLPGGYVIDAPLGVGGFGAVYAGRDTQLDRPVAIKLLTRALEPKAMRRFRDEGRLLAKLQHPNIIQVYALGELDDQRGYLVMERFGSGSLSDHWPRGQRPPLALALSIARQVLSALSAAHRAGVIHRDIKEPNILFDSGSGVVKLCDFGIARSVTPLLNQAETTEEGVIIGSLPYLAPERLNGARGDELSDLYAVGVLLFRLLTGRRPFEADPHERLSPHVQITKTLTEPPQLPDGLAPRWGRLCLALLEKDPQRRPQSADRALQLLDDSLELSLTESAPIRRSSERLLALSETPDRPSVWRAWLLWSLLGALLTFAYLKWASYRTPAPQRPPQRRVLQLGHTLEPTLQPKLSGSERTAPPSAPPPTTPSMSVIGKPSDTATRPSKEGPSLPSARGQERSTPKRRTRSKPKGSTQVRPPQVAPRPESPFVFPK